MTDTAKYPTLRAFLEEATSGRHTVDEVAKMLDDVEEGIGLMEHDRQTAAAMEMIADSDATDPAYRRGFELGADGIFVALLPILRKAEWIEGRCPNCEFETVHKGNCLLDRLLREGRDRDAQEAAEKKLNAGAPIPEPMS